MSLLVSNGTNCLNIFQPLGSVVCVTVCAFDGHICEPYKIGCTIEMLFGIYLGVPEEPSIRWGPWFPRERGNFGRDIFSPIIKCREYPACCRYSQPYSVGGSVDAAFCCQYYSRVVVFWADVLQLCLNCPSLTELDLSDAGDITVQSVEHIVSHLTSLRYLALSRCYYVTQALSWVPFRTI